MRHLGNRIAIIWVLFFLMVFVYAKYKIIEIRVKPASDYSAHQNFQDIVIGAYPYDSEVKVKQIFDTDKLSEKGFLPVLMVIENNNSFPIRVNEEEIFLIQKDGFKQKTLYFIDVLLAAHMKDPLSEKSGSKQFSIEKIVKKEMLLDFEHKSFGEKLIAPYGSDHGVVFFKIPDDGLEDTYLYLPEILNVTESESLMFFEFPLK